MASKDDYMMGHSTAEGDRLEEQHNFFSHVTDDQLLSPHLQQSVRKGLIKRILDVGTGTGIWCKDAAEQIRQMSPQTSMEIVGIDIAPSDYWPKYSQAPKGGEGSTSITFEVVDLNDDETMEAPAAKYGQFDLVHSRMVISAIKDRQWQPYVGRAFSLLRSGGYVQLLEADMINTGIGRIHDPTVAEALVITHCVYRGMGLDPEAAVRIAKWLHQAGFVAIRDTAFWCYPLERKSDGTLEADEDLRGWHLSAFRVLQPLFLKLRHSENYAQLLDKLPPHAFENSPNGRPQEQLANEEEYEEFLQRHEEVVRHNPAYQSVFRVVVARKP